MTSITKERYAAMKASMPWVTHVTQVGAIGGVVKMIDKNGNEVPIFDMTDLLALVTSRMSKAEAEPPPEQ